MPTAQQTTPIQCPYPQASGNMLDYDILYSPAAQGYYADIFNPVNGWTTHIGPYCAIEEEAMAYADQWIGEHGAAIPLVSQAYFLSQDVQL